MRLQKITYRYSVFLPVAVHDGWSRWSPDPVDHCNCYGRVRQTRRCTNPPLSCQGSPCSGRYTRYVECNECSCNNGGCEHNCVETISGRTCSCLPGYKRSGRSCSGMWILRVDVCSQVSLALPWSEKVLFDFEVQTCAKMTVRANNRPEGERGFKNEKIRSLSVFATLRHNNNIWP